MEGSHNFVTCKIDITHTQYDVIKMLGVKTNITFGFLIPIFPIRYATFGKLSRHKVVNS